MSPTSKNVTWITDSQPGLLWRHMIMLWQRMRSVCALRFKHICLLLFKLFLQNKWWQPKATRSAEAIAAVQKVSFDPSDSSWKPQNGKEPPYAHQRAVVPWQRPKEMRSRTTRRVMAYDWLLRLPIPPTWPRARRWAWPGVPKSAAATREYHSPAGMNSSPFFLFVQIKRMWARVGKCCSVESQWFFEFFTSFPPEAWCVVASAVLRSCRRCCRVLGFLQHCPAWSPRVKSGPFLHWSFCLSLFFSSFYRAFLYDHKNRKCQWLSFDTNSSGVQSLEDFNYQLYQKKGTTVAETHTHTVTVNNSTIVFCFKSQTSPSASNYLFTNWTRVCFLERQI